LVDLSENIPTPHTGKGKINKTIKKKEVAKFLTPFKFALYGNFDTISATKSLRIFRRQNFRTQTIFSSIHQILG